MKLSYAFLAFLIYDCLMFRSSQPARSSINPQIPAEVGVPELSEVAKQVFPAEAAIAKLAYLVPTSVDRQKAALDPYRIRGAYAVLSRGHGPH